MDKVAAFIEKLQRKPIGQKRLIVLGSSLLITGFIFIVWISTSTLFSSSKNEALIPNKTASPFAAFSQNVGLVVSSVKDLWSGKDTGKDFNPTVTPGPSSGSYGTQATTSAPVPQPAPAEPSVGIPQIPRNNY